MTQTKVKVCVPKQNFITVKAEKPEKVTESEGGLALPDSAVPILVKRIGTVIAIGPETTRVEIGERILFAAHSGTTIEVDGEELEFMPDDLVWARVG